MKQLKITSPAFEHNQQIPEKYGCKNKAPNPPITIEGTPPKATSLALIMDDPDAPSGTFDHWIVWNIPPSTTRIDENAALGKEGLNSSGKRGYVCPFPPSGTHRYFFKVFALNMMLDLSANSGKRDLEKAMKGHIVAQGELVGLFTRK
jgi:Raf kinase inhibitor-like YbhB/YbcL family protein